MKRKKIIVLFTSILGFLTFFIYLVDNKKSINPGIVEHFNLTSQSFDHLTTQEDLIYWLETKEKLIWNELLKDLNLTTEQFEAFRAKNQKIYANSIADTIKTYGSEEKVTLATQNFIKEIFVEFGIDPDAIQIVAWKLSSAAAAIDTLLFINEEIFNELSIAAKKYAIGHELIHVIKKDHSTKCFIEEINYPLTIDTKSSTSYNKLSRFQEIRADILSCLQGMDYAQGACIYFKEFILLNGDGENPSHPKSSLRLKLGTKIAGILTQKKAIT